MKRILASGSALALAGSGAIAFAGPLGAQEGDILEELPPIEIEVRGAELSPSTAAPGAEITVTSTDPCEGYEGLPAEEQTLYWGVLDQGEFPGWEAYAQFGPEDKLPAWQVGEAELAEDGSWTVSFQAPPTAGNYEFVGVCPVANMERNEDTDEVPPEEEAPEEGEEPEGEEEGDGHEHALSDGIELVSFPGTGDFKHKKRSWDWDKGSKKGHDDKRGKDHKKKYRFWCGWKKKPKHPEHPTTTTTTTEEETTTTTEEETTTTTEEETTTTTAPEEEPEGPYVGIVYGPLDLVVEGGEAPPAPPVTGQPSYTG